MPTQRSIDMRAKKGTRKGPNKGTGMSRRQRREGSKPRPRQWGLNKRNTLRNRIRRERQSVTA